MLVRLLLLLLAVPLADLLVSRILGARLGTLGSLWVILATGALGIWVMRSQGLRALRRLVESLQTGRLPRDDVWEGLLVLGAGLALLAPGFLGDAIGGLLLIPSLRAWTRQQLATFLERRATLRERDSAQGTRARSSEEVIIEAEVLRDPPTAARDDRSPLPPSGSASSFPHGQADRNPHERR